MFARFLEVTPKMEKKEQLIETVRKEVIPILKKQPGFIELLPFAPVPETTNEKVVVISLWADKFEAEKYVKEVFPKVEQILKPFFAAPIVHKPYELETRLCKHFVEALTVA